MAERPRRPDIAPGDGKALPVVTYLRMPNGQFAGRLVTPSEPVASPVSDPIDPKPPASPGTVAKPPRAASPAQLIARVTRAIERELAQIEEIVGAAMSAARRRGESEKRARTLASLARTLAEVTRLRAAASESKAKDDDDAVPRDLDEFRATLERRLAQLVAERQERAARPDDRG